MNSILQKAGVIFLGFSLVGVVGCSPSPDSSSSPAASSPPSSSNEYADMQNKTIQLFFPDSNRETILVGQDINVLVKTIHDNPQESFSTKIDAITVLADINTNVLEEKLDESTTELYNNFVSNAIIDNQDKLFLLKQVYNGRLVENHAPNEGREDIGFRYYKISRDLYRDTELRDSEYITSNMSEIQEILNASNGE